MREANQSARDRCPACSSPAAYFLDWEFSGLGDSIFNYTAQFFCCQDCSLVYVQNIDDGRLAQYYAGECSYFEKPHFAVTSSTNQQKYETYIRFLNDNGVAPVDMADVGCGRGGFVSRLSERWEATCWGVDVDMRSMPQGARKDKVAFRMGDAAQLPFGDHSLGLLTYFHILEHVRDLHGLLSEAVRVLQPDGFILIEVPDAESYRTHPIGSAFWISIREHIYHYTAKALIAALQSHGFHILQVSRQILPTPEFSYPSLMVLARKTEQPAAIASIPIAGDVAAYVLESREALFKQAQEVLGVAESQHITLWGCSAELFSLLPLLDRRRVRICDSSKLKQTTSYKGMAIEDPRSVPISGKLIIAPYLHGGAIKSTARQLGWSESAMYLLH